MLTAPLKGSHWAQRSGICEDEKGGIEMDKRKQYTVTNAGAQVVQPVHKQPAGTANQVVRGTDLRTGQTCKKG